MIADLCAPKCLHLRDAEAALDRLADHALLEAARGGVTKVLQKPLDVAELAPDAYEQLHRDDGASSVLVS